MAIPTAAHRYQRDACRTMTQSCFSESATPKTASEGQVAFRMNSRVVRDGVNWQRGVGSCKLRRRREVRFSGG
jgi:hypothetical protein